MKKEQAIKEMIAALNDFLDDFEENTLKNAENKLETILSSISQVEDKVDGLDEKFNQISSRQPEMKESIDQTVESLNNRLDNFDREIEHHLHSLKGPVNEALLEDMAGLMGQVREITETIDTCRDTHLENFENWKESIRNGQEELQEKITAAADSFKQFHETAANCFAGIAEDCIHFEKLTKDCLDSFTQDSDQEKQMVSRALAKAIVEQLCSRIIGDGEKLCETLHELAEFADQKTGWIKDSVGQVTDKLQEIIDIIEPVKPALEQIRNVL